MLSRWWRNNIPLCILRRFLCLFAGGLMCSLFPTPDCCEWCWNKHGCRCLFNKWISFLLDFISPGCQGVGLLGHMVMLPAFWGTSKLFVTMAALVYIPAKSTQGSPLHTLATPPVPIWITANLTWERWYLIAVLIHISLMFSDAEHFLVSLFVLCMSSHEKCLLRFTA